MPLPSLLRRLLLGSTLALLTTATSRAQAPAPAPAPAGLWQGALSVPGGELKLLFRFGPAAAGGYGGIITVPQQGITNRPFASVLVRADSVVARLDAPPAQYRGRLSADGQQLGGVWQQGAGALPLTLRRVPAEAEAAATAAPRRPQTPQAPFPYRATDVQFRNAAANVVLAGTLTLPPGKGPFPAVVLVTGSGPQDRDETLLGHKPFLVLADYLTRRGIAVLRYDRGVGKSGGDFKAGTTADFARDAQAALAYLRGRPEVRPQQVGLVGHSEGGLIAWRTAAQPSGGPDFIVSLAGPGVAGVPLMLRQQQDIGRTQGLDSTQLGQLRRLNAAVFAELARQPFNTPDAQALPQLVAAAQRALPGLPATQAEAQVRPLLTPWARNFVVSNPAADLRRVRCPVLALNGSKDLQVAADVNLPAIAQALQAAGNRDVTTQALPGLNHLFQTAATGSPAEYATLEETFALAALQCIGDWLTQHTKP